MKTVLLIGISGVYNYGCEGIVRGTEAILRSRWPDLRVIYASRRPLQDEEALTGTRVEIVSRRFARYSWKNILRKGLAIGGVQWTPRSDDLGLLRGVDAVLSIGGDIYTMRPDGTFGEGLMKFGDAAERRGVPYILWGASVGPFPKHSRAERSARRHLSRISAIAARESRTVDYLQSLGVCENVVSCADPAFAVSPSIRRERGLANRRRRVAVNLSPLSFWGRTGEREAVLARQARMCERIVSQFNADLYLVPHVVCSMVADDDRAHLAAIAARIQPAMQGQVTLVGSDLGFVGTKQFLASCDLAIAARMHCGINAMAAGVPTILLAYSEKALGMSEYVYGSREWVVPIDEFDSERCLLLLERMFAENEAVRDHLVARSDSIRSDAHRPVLTLEHVLGGNRRRMEAEPAGGDARR